MLNIVLHHISLISNGWTLKNHTENRGMAYSRNCLTPRAENFTMSYRRKWELLCLSNWVALLLFLFSKGNECCLCFSILVHRLMEPKSSIHIRWRTVHNERPLFLALEVLTGPWIHWGVIWNERDRRLLKRG